MKMFALAVLLVVPVPVFAQMPESAAEPVPASITVGMRVGEMPSSYDDGGRRDPFTSLVMPKRQALPGTGGRVRPGLGNMVLADVVVRGIIRSGTSMFAILETPGKQSYVAKVKDKLADAVIQSIDANGVVFLEMDGTGQPANPASKVRKDLRSAEDAGDEDR
jgi:hypothetical protein